MLGVWVNCGAIILGSLIGLLFKNVVSKSISEVIRIGIGFCTFVVATKMALRFESFLFVVACVTLGGIFGTLIHLEEKLEQLGEKIRQWTGAKKESSFAYAFAMTSVLYCTGAMAILGPIDAAISRNYEVLFAKSMLDGTIAITFAAIYGIGVAFSSISILIYQGGIALLATQLQFLKQPTVINNLSGVGGVLVLMIGFSVSGIYKVKVGDFFPAILIALILSPFWHF